jgi:8-hydroxy-5-deazaflavin:NADPH oxidoreductase
MKVAVFGSGDVGSHIADKLKSLGHDVVYGTRHPGGDKGGVPLLSHDDAARHGDWIVNALHGEAAVEVLPPLELAGKTLVDIGNWQSAIDGPIEETLGEALQRLMPEVHVIKATNFVSASLMGHPEKLSGTHTNFVAGNDAERRGEVVRLLEEFGWQDVVDLGDITASRAMESLAPMWIRLNDKFGHVWFNFALLRTNGEPDA